MGKIFNSSKKHKNHTEKNRYRDAHEMLCIRDVVVGQDVCQMLDESTASDFLYAENFRKLRACIISPRDYAENPRCLMVTSTYPGEGKTFVAANLAVSIALGIDEHVLLVDCDLRRPNLHNMLGCPNTAGLHEYLVDKMPLSELILRTRIGKLSILPAGTMPHNPSELVASKMMEAFLEEVKARYPDRYIVIDSTPSFIMAEAQVLAGKTDGIILVVMAGRAPRHAVQKTVENLGSEKILGVVFNGYNQPLNGYRKFYKRYYGKKK